MKKLLLLTAALFAVSAAAAQQARMLRSEAVPFDNRHDAAVGADRTRSSQ